jgi:exopolysaccharide biosynthesis polyprenyl glycosylphosphotransferase
MKKDFGLIFRICLILGDAFAISLSFLLAYFMRTHLDQRPFYFESEPWKFVASLLLLLPIYVIILAAFGLYRKSIFLSRNRWSEIGRLFLASVVGVMAIISYDFFMLVDLFPVRILALYTVISCFLLLCTFRGLVRMIRKLILKSKRAILRVVIVGSTKNTEYLADYIAAFPESGFTLAGVVSAAKYIPKDLRRKQYSSLKEALRKAKPDVIFQTDDRHTDYVYRQAIERHLLYYFVPSNSMLTSQMGELELIGDTPAILVNITPLAGGAKVVKRLCDVIFSIVALIIAAVPMGIIWIMQKIADPKAPVIYAETRLSRYNRRFKIYKFRSMKPEYSGLSPEEAFTKMGKPQLIKKYRQNGDKIPNDPRITKLGKFLRASSLDELPQLFNVLRGDISLVGPRALVPGELHHYGDRSLLLSVKSGLTGLAQVSGRRDISFDERRALDLYYIQNWSLSMDFRIMFRTIGAVLFRRGAK